MNSFESCTNLAQLLSGFDQVFAVPGFPVTHVLASLEEAGAHIVWSASEKVAIEGAVGAALSGTPSLVVIKHNGLGVAADSLANAAAHQVAAPMLVVVGDDVDAQSSTSYVDSRELATALGILCFTPSLSGDLPEIVDHAIAASVTTGAPAMVRITGRIHDHCGAGNLADYQSADPPRLDGFTADAHLLTKLSRLVRALGLAATAQRNAHIAGIDTLDCRDAHASLVVAVGDIEVPVGNACVARVRSTVPSPGTISAVANHELVIVAEEGAPVIERQLLGVRGRQSRHLPRWGRITPAMIAAAAGGRHIAEPALDERPAERLPVMEPLFAALARHRHDGVFVATDVGSTVALSYPPFNGADSALALGSGPAVAAGAIRCGRRAIAVVGDYALLHSGMTGMIEAAAARLPLVTVVVENGVQEKTGGQPLPYDGPELLLAGGAAGEVRIVAGDTWTAEGLYRELAAALDEKAPIVIRYRGNT